MAWEGRAFSSGAGGVAGQALEWGENLAFQRASSCRQGSGLSISLVHGLMKVEFLTPLVQTGQDWVLSPVPATFQGLLLPWQPARLRRLDLMSHSLTRVDSLFLISAVFCNRLEEQKIAPTDNQDRLF